MMNKFSVVVCLIGLFVSTGAARAAIALNDYTLNFSDAASALPGFTSGNEPGNLENVDDWSFTAFSLVAFQDNDDSGTITKNDTFKDFVFARVDGFNDKDGNDITPTSYGGSAGNTHQMTMLSEFSGTQTSTFSDGVGTYDIDTLDFFDVYFDAEDEDEGYTDFNLVTNDNLDTYDNGVKVESAELISGGGVQDDSQDLPNGTISLLMTLEDLLDDPAEFEKDFLDADGNLISGLTVDVSGLVLGLVDANNNAQQLNTFASAIETRLPTSDLGDVGDNGFVNGDGGSGFSIGGNSYDFGFITKSEGSLNKQFIPEPASMAIWGVLGSLVGFGLVRRQRRS